MQTIDCPCGFGKQIPATEPRCHVCGADLGPLARLARLPETLLNSGLQLAAAGRPEAFLQLAAASAVTPGRPDALLALGKLLESTDAALLARACYDQVLATSQDHPEAREGRDRLTGKPKPKPRNRMAVRMIRRFKLRQAFFTWSVYGLVLGLMLGLAVASVAH